MRRFIRKFGVVFTVFFVATFLTVEAAPTAGGVNSIAGYINPTSGAVSLYAVNEYVVQNGQVVGIPADPADWTLTSSLGYTVQSAVPTSIFAPTQPLQILGPQVFTLEACNAATAGNCYQETRPIGWIDYELYLENTERSIVAGQSYQMDFTLTNVLANGYPYLMEGVESVSVQGLLSVNFPYSGNATPVLLLSDGTVTSCSFQGASSGNTHTFTCEIYVPVNTQITGSIQIPSDHGQSVFNTSWRLEHTYHQPGVEAEYPYNSLNTPSAVYGLTPMYLPLFRKS